MKPETPSVILAVAILTVRVTGETGTRLWEQEPALREIARQHKLVRPLSPEFGWEGPGGKEFGARIDRTPGPGHSATIRHPASSRQGITNVQARPKIQWAYCASQFPTNWSF